MVQSGSKMNYCHVTNWLWRVNIMELLPLTCSFYELHHSTWFKCKNNIDPSFFYLIWEDKIAVIQTFVVVIHLFIYLSYVLYTLPFRGLGSARFFMFLKKSLMFTNAALFGQKYCKSSFLLKKGKNKKCNLFLWCKAEFSASLLQSVTSHDPSEIMLIFWFGVQETFIIILIFVILWWIESSKEKYLSENIRSVCNIKSVSFDQFITSLVNTFIIYIKKEL